MAKIRKRKLVSNKGKTTRWVYLVDYRPPGDKRRAKQFPTRREAEAWMHQAMVDIKDGLHVPDSKSVTLKDAGKMWLGAVEFTRQRRSATIKQYKTHLNRHICDRGIGIGGVKLSQLTSAGIVKFHQDLAKKKSLSTADKVLKSLKSILKEAQLRGLIKVNVAMPVGMYKRSITNKYARIPPREDVVTLLRGAPEKLWRPMLYVAALCGLRAGELRALTWAKVNLKSGIIKVDQAADLNSEITTPKSQAGYRDVPMPPSVVAELRRWKLACPSSPLKLVFPNRAGNVLAQNAIYRNLWGKLMRQFGFIVGGENVNGKIEGGRPAFRFHDLRHVAASLYIKSGADPKRLSVIMGHSSIKITFDLYGHLWEDLEGDKALAQGAEKALFSD
ncbi:MAG: site-specific integrase [Proteobacteria bacterium]|nr:site-specific integrase [Pseudomonadota bacterium]